MKIKCTLFPLALVSLLTFISGEVVTTDGAESEAEKPVLSRIPQLKTFIEAKERQAREDTKLAGEKVAPEAWSFFEAARTENWREATQIWKNLRRRSHQYSNSRSEATVDNAAWQPLLEVDLVVDFFYKGEPKYSELFGRGIADSLPRGAIYFGGTDPGRGVVTAFCKSHAEGDPFFVLTQNALADSSYLDYLRRMYGKKIYIPSPDDSSNAFAEYLADAQRRLEHDQKHPTEPKQLKPGEDIKMVDGKVNVSGQVAVMAINALLTKIIFDKNPNREFYIEESFPLDWMYSQLTPHAWIMKINRQPLAQIPEETLRKDHDFWTAQIKKMLGDWLGDDTSVKDICAFTDKVFGDRDLEGFRGDAAFVENDYASKSFSKLRSAIGGVYAWRMNNTKSGEERKRMLKEADFASRQALALCPYSPEAVFRYVNILISQQRLDDALTVAGTGCKIDPGNGQFQNLRVEIKRLQRKAAPHTE